MIVDDTTVQLLSILIVLVTFVVSVIVTQFIRRRKDAFPLRSLAVYARLPRITGEAVEANRPIHLAMGSTGIGDRGTILSLAAAEFFYYVAREAAIGDTSPIITVSNTSAIPLGQDTLRRAYVARNTAERFRANNVRWYPAGSRSLAYAAAITAMQQEDRVSSNIFIGQFGPELALMMDGAHRRRQPSLGGSNLLEGQAVAYALADDVLIGEELFMAGPYLGNEANLTSVAVATDVLRWLLILGILAIIAARLLGG